MARRSAKQRANDKRLGRMARKRHKTVKRKRSSTKSMARRRRSPRRRSARRAASRGFSRARRGVGSVRSKLTGGPVGDLIKARGAGQVFADFTDKVAPQYSPMTKLVGEYLGGGVKGLIYAEGEQLLLGKPSAISSLGNLIPNFGGGGNGGLSV